VPWRVGPLRQVKERLQILSRAVMATGAGMP
jgi:hypothetical protein